MIAQKIEQSNDRDIEMKSNDNNIDFNDYSNDISENELFMGDIINDINVDEENVLDGLSNKLFFLICK